ncbi:MAG TPA: hypothetical protein DEA08_05970 [Planctomycetes bacterium]|nr:hypothetical protein [Planctomycetota bacterium]
MKQSGNEHGLFTAGAARQALELIKRNRGGSLLVTSGHQDVRLVVEPRRVSVEGSGGDVSGGDAWSLCRAFLLALFWGEATYFLQLDGKPDPKAPAIRLETQASKVLEALDEGLQELTSLREQVPGVDVLVHVTGEGPPEDVESCAADLFRVLGDQPRHLGMAAEEAGLDPIDAAWGVSDLLEAEQAGVRRAPPTLSVRRLKSAEPTTGEGLLPAVRHLHLSRGFSRSDPRRSARHLQEAGASFLHAGLAEDALNAFRNSLELAPKDTGGLEGMIEALDALKKKGEAQKIREELIQLYRSWHLPSRVLFHLDHLGGLDAQNQQLRLNCLLERRDFAAALDFAKKLVPSMKAEERYDLARRFCEAGVSGAQRERVLAMAGVYKLRWPRRLLILASLLLFVAALGLGAEVFLRSRFQQAALQTRIDLDSANYDQVDGHWQELRGILAKAPALAKLPPGFALRETVRVEGELAQIQADHETLRDPAQRKALQWRSWDLVSDADRALEDLAKRAKSEALRQRVAETRKEIAAYLDEVRAEVKAFSGLTRPASKLSEGLNLLRKHHRAREVFADQAVVLVIDVIPVIDGVTLTWKPDGEAAQTLSPVTAKRGRYEARLKLAPDTAGLLSASARNHVPRELRIKLTELPSHIVSFELVRAVPVPPRVQHPSKRGLSLPDGGVVVLEAALPDRDFKRSGIEELSVASSEASMAFLGEDLAEGERVIVELLDSVSPGRPPRVFLSGIRLWVDRGGQLGEGSLIDLGGPVLRGLKRPLDVRGNQAELSSVDQASGFERVKHALGYLRDQARTK